MKKFFLLLSLLVVPVFSVPATAAEQKPNRATEARVPATVDFFNFEAMRKSGLGKYVRGRVFESLGENPEMSTSLKKLNADFGLNLPESLRLVSIIHFPEAKLPKFDVAQIATDDDFSAFFERLKKQKSAEFSLDGLRFFALPPEMRPLVPAIFKFKTSEIFAASTGKRGEVVLVACSRAAVPRLADSDLSVKIPAENEKFPVPGVLFFCVFSRKDVAPGKEKYVCPSVPAGDFLLEENAGRARIAVSFLCENPGERKLFQVFFAELKSKIHATAPRLVPVANSIAESTDGNRIRFEIGGNEREMTEFLMWRENQLPPQKKRKVRAF